MMLLPVLFLYFMKCIFGLTNCSDEPSHPFVFDFINFRISNGMVGVALTGCTLHKARIPMRKSF